MMKSVPRTLSLSCAALTALSPKTHFCHPMVIMVIRIEYRLNYGTLSGIGHAQFCQAPFGSVPGSETLQKGKPALASRLPRLIWSLSTVKQIDRGLTCMLAVANKWSTFRFEPHLGFGVDNEAIFDTVLNFWSGILENNWLGNALYVA